MKTPQNVRPGRRATVFTLAGSIAALLSAQLTAQTTITYTNGQTAATSRSITAPNNPTTLTIASSTATQSGVLSGSGTVIKTGAGTLALSGANTFSGPVQVNGGTLDVFHNSNLGAAGNTVTLTGGTLQTSSTYSSHPLAIGNASTVDVARGFTTLQNAALTGSAALTKRGSGTFSLVAGSGNTFSGNLILAVDGGTFQVGGSLSASPASGASLPGLTSSNTITINRGATFNVQDNGSSAGFVADRFGTAGNRPNVVIAGGSLTLLGASNSSGIMTQTFGGLTMPSGASTITVTRTSGTPELIFSSLTRSPGAFGNFTGTALGSGTSDGRLLFTSAPALVGGGGGAGSTTISILPGARSGSELATYGVNGVRPLVAAEYNAAPANNLNGATATENVKISDAATPTFAALAGAKTINALVVTAAANATWAMGNTLTLTSGQFIHTASNSLDINSGILTAGTGAAGTIDLDMTVTNNSVNLLANVNDNGATAVSLVKNGSAALVLNSLSNNTYSGGTVINDGPISTGGSAGRRYLGTGAVVIQPGGALGLSAAGATSFNGSRASPTYWAKTGGSVTLAIAVPASNEFFKLETGAAIATFTTAIAAALDLDTNLNAAPGAVLAERVAGANLAIRKGGVAIQSAITTPTYYFGISASTGVQENVTVGAGTPWLGISTGRGPATYAGTSNTNNTITANSDFDLQGFPSFTLSLGGGASATNIVKIAKPNGSVTANIAGLVNLNNDNSQYGSGVGNTVTFQVLSGATLGANTATALGVVGGSATAPASVVVRNGGTLTIGNPTAINGAVTLLPGALFTQSQATLSGTGTFTHSNGSILNLTDAAAVSGATQALGTMPGTIVRLNAAGLLPGTTTAGATQFDSRLHDAAVLEITTALTMGAASAATDSLFTLSASGGVGGVLTNDVSSPTLSATIGRIAIGSGGGTFAATTGTTLTVAEDFALGANTLTIGSTQSSDGKPKLGIVTLGSTANASTGNAGSVISVVNGATLRFGASDQIPNAAALNIPAGATVDLATFNDTVGGVRLTGGVISGTTGVLASATAYDLQAGSASAILAGVVGANKTTAGSVTLSGANTFSGNTTVSQGTLALSGSGSFASSPTIAIASGATLDVSAVTGGANHDGTRFAIVSGQTLQGTGNVLGGLDVSAGGTIAPGNSIGTLATAGLSLTSASSTFKLEIDLGLPAADLLTVTGGISLANSNLDLTLFNLMPMSQPKTFLFAANDLSDPVTGTFGTISGVPIGYMATVDYGFLGTDAVGRIGDGNDLAITFAEIAAVPEPATAAWGLAVGLLAVSRRRRVSG